MKKSAVLFILSICLMLTGCAGNFEKYDAHISEIRDGYYLAANASGKFSAVSGERENPYEIDGVSNKRVDFFIVTFEPVNYDVTAKYSFTVKVNGTEFEGQFKPHPFNRSYSFEVNRRSNEKTVALMFLLGENKEEVILTEVKTESMISADRAFNIAVNRFKDKLTEFKKRNDKYEIYIRLVNDHLGGEDKFCWYVSFNDGESIYAMLINPLTMEIEAIRE